MFGVRESALRLMERGYVPDLLIIDEAHNVAAYGAYQKMLELCPAAKVLGMTATPWRGDEYDISQAFGPPRVQLGISDGMRNGYLAQVDYKLFSDEESIDWDFVERLATMRTQSKT